MGSHAVAGRNELNLQGKLANHRERSQSGGKVQEDQKTAFTWRSLMGEKKDKASGPPTLMKSLLSSTHSPGTRNAPMRLLDVILRMTSCHLSVLLSQTADAVQLTRQGVRNQKRLGGRGNILREETIKSILQRSGGGVRGSSHEPHILSCVRDPSVQAVWVAVTSSLLTQISQDSLWASQTAYRIAQCFFSVVEFFPLELYLCGLGV